VLKLYLLYFTLIVFYFYTFKPYRFTFPLPPLFKLEPRGFPPPPPPPSYTISLFLFNPRGLPFPRLQNLLVILNFNFLNCLTYLIN
jgi:hypothetical protein